MEKWDVITFVTEHSAPREPWPARFVVTDLLHHMRAFEVRRLTFGALVAAACIGSLTWSWYRFCHWLHRRCLIDTRDDAELPKPWTLHRQLSWPSRERRRRAADEAARRERTSFEAGRTLGHSEVWNHLDAEVDRQFPRKKGGGK